MCWSWGEASVKALIARRTEFWWNPKRPVESTLWESNLELSEDLSVLFPLRVAHDRTGV